MNKELALEEAENIVDNMYKNRWEECGVEDGNTIHMGNLSNLKYNELESASILLLRTEIRLKKENKKYKEVIDKAIEYIWRTEINSIGTPLAYITIGKELLDILKEVE